MSIQRRRRAIAARTSVASSRARRRALRTRAVSRTSGSATATRVSSRLSTRVFPLASRISPRGAAVAAAKYCCRLPRADHTLPSATCTLAARPISATANRTRKPWTTATRLGGFTLSLSGKYYDLIVSGDVHSKARLHDGTQLLTARCLADLGLEARAIALER